MEKTSFLISRHRLSEARNSVTGVGMGKNNPLLHTSPTGCLSWDVESDNYPNTCLLLAGQGKLLCLPETNAARSFQVLVESIIRTLNAVLRKRQKKRKKIAFGGCLQLSYGLVPKDIKILVLIRCLFTHLTKPGREGECNIILLQHRNK